MAHRVIPSLMAGLLLAMPVASFAQTVPVAAATPAPATKPAAPAPRDAAIERRITELHARLKITPAEQKPFDDFAQVMRDNAQRMGALVKKRQDSFATGTAVDQMRSYTDMAQAHADDMTRLTASFSTLYDSLSPDQKKQADVSFRQFAKTRRSSLG